MTASERIREARNGEKLTVATTSSMRIFQITRDQALALSAAINDKPDVTTMQILQMNGPYSDLRAILSGPSGTIETETVHGVR